MEPKKEKGVTSDHDYDDDTMAPGRSREVDAIAHEALRELRSEDGAFHVTEGDHAHEHEHPQGNPESDSYSNKRKIGGS